jgi:hypothetical protein
MRKILITSLLCVFTFLSKAQEFQDIQNIVLDLTSLTQSYITPAVEGISHQTTNGWFSSSDIGKPWQITGSVQANLLIIPNDRRNFTVNENELNNISIIGSETTAQTPTGIGGENTIELQGNIGEESFTFTTPDGINENNLWHAQFQVGLTLPYRSEVIVRYAPRIDIGDAEYQSYGFGIHHSISQWFKALEESSWSFSTLIYYTKIDFSTSFDEIDLVLGSIDLGKAESNAVGFNLIGSKRINSFTLTGALNYTTSVFDYSIGGDNQDLLNILNAAIATFDNNISFATGNFSVRYDWSKFSVFSSFSFGQFQNLIFGFNYTLDTTK